MKFTRLTRHKLVIGFHRDAVNTYVNSLDLDHATTSTLRNALVF